MPYSAFQPLHAPCRHGRPALAHVSMPYSAFQPLHRAGRRRAVVPAAVLMASFAFPPLHQGWPLHNASQKYSFNALLGIPAVAPHRVNPAMTPADVSMPYSAFQPLHRTALASHGCGPPRFQCPTRHSSRCTFGCSDLAAFAIEWFQCPTRHSSRCTRRAGPPSSPPGPGFNALLGIPAVAPHGSIVLLGCLWGVSMPYSAFQPLHRVWSEEVEAIEAVSMPYSAFQPLHRSCFTRAILVLPVSMPYSAFQPLHPRHLGVPPQDLDVSMPYSAFQPLHLDLPIGKHNRNPVSMPYSAFQPLHPLVRRLRQGVKIGFNALLGIPAVAPPKRKNTTSAKASFNALLGIPAVAPGARGTGWQRARGGFNALLGIPAVAPRAAQERAYQSPVFQCPTRHSSRCTPPGEAQGPHPTTSQLVAG